MRSNRAASSASWSTVHDQTWTRSSSKTQHRIPEGYVIALCLKNGFVLAGVAEINANPIDDETPNVHNMLPQLKEGNESLKVIGESDRMTLKFVKPAQTSISTR
jgi:predicted methyltransferase